jgi:hypothetical protein
MAHPQEQPHGQAAWKRDYFDSARDERGKHRLTRIELEELCFWVGFLHNIRRWPPEVQQSAGRDEFGMATLQRPIGPVFVQTLHDRAAGTRHVGILFTVLAEHRRIRIVNVVDAGAFRQHPKLRDTLYDAAALRAMVAGRL